jgi:hypothetical protein
VSPSIAALSNLTLEGTDPASMLISPAELSSVWLPLPKQKWLEPTEKVKVAFAKDAKSFSYYRELFGQFWHEVEKHDLCTYLAARGCSKDDIAQALTPEKPFELVNKPFQGEHPGPLKWNLSKTQFAFERATEDGPFPTYESILDHCGRGLTPSVQLDEWCRDNGIHTGAAYLKLWCARMFRYGTIIRGMIREDQPLVNTF